MTASYSKKSGYCGCGAAACASMPLRNSLDTAILAVSLVILRRIAAIRT